MQTSTEADPRSKIRKTIRRLRAFGRTPHLLYYVTNQVVPTIDTVEDSLGLDLAVAIRIRDRNYITSHIADTTATIAAYYNHIAHRTDFLHHVAQDAVIRKSIHVSDPHVYTYLAGVLDHQSPSSSFADSVVDAMILYALEGTDPDRNVRMSESDIRARILAILPAAESLLGERLRRRLVAISQKDNRRISWYKQDDLWVLRYQDRRVLEETSIQDAALRLDARRELATQVSRATLPVGQHPVDISDLALKVVQLAFEQDGLQFSYSLSDTDPEAPTPFVSDAVRSALDTEGLTGQAREDTAEALGKALRIVFYQSTAKVRTLLRRMSRAYGIAFVLKGEPRVVRYFDNVLTNTWLYVGSDVIISALSERYLQPEDQHTRNLLKASFLAGAELRLTAPVLDEILGHLRKADREYTHYVEPLGPIDSYEAVRQIPGILIRAFLYTQIFVGEHKPYSWETFIEQFCDYAVLHRPDAVDQLRVYLTEQFNLHFETWTEVNNVCRKRRHDYLTASLLSIKSDPRIARTDAYVYQLVTTRRQTRREETIFPEYGHKTWWLSFGEDTAVKAMASLDGSTPRILMRPGFLAKFIQLAPSASLARDSLSDFIPSILGIKLARRMTEGDFHKLFVALEETESLEESRRAAKIGSFVDQLKSTGRNEYKEQFELDTTREFIPVDSVFRSQGA